jgi:hypothetical protein
MAVLSGEHETANLCSFTVTILLQSELPIKAVNKTAYLGSYTEGFQSSEGKMLKTAYLGLPTELPFREVSWSLRK